MILFANIYIFTRRVRNKYLRINVSANTAVKLSRNYNNKNEIFNLPTTLLYCLSCIF